MRSMRGWSSEPSGHLRTRGGGLLNRGVHATVGITGEAQAWAMQRFIHLQRRTTDGTAIITPLAVEVHGTHPAGGGALWVCRRSLVEGKIDAAGAAGDPCRPH